LKGKGKKTRNPPQKKSGSSKGEKGGNFGRDRSGLHTWTKKVTAASEGKEGKKNKEEKIKHWHRRS